MVAAMVDDRRERGVTSGAHSPEAHELDRALWLGVRQGLLIALGAVETYLQLPRSAPSRRTRRGFARKTLLPKVDEE